MVSTPEAVKGERFAFTAQIKKMMGLIINTFYSNKDVFLRELISNSSDAVDKIKFLSLTDQSILGEETDFKIEIEANPETKTLIIRDNGIGMTKDDMIKNLGTIANSGTKNFMDAISAGADIQMIGQFGVGFYSAFLVSDKVQVRSKHNDDVQHVWESAAGEEFDIYVDTDNEHQLKRGTEIIMHLKEDQTDYLEERKLKEIIKKHSEFVGTKIFLLVTKEVKKKVPKEKDESAEQESKTKVKEIEDGDESKAYDAEMADVEGEDKIKPEDEEVEDAESKNLDGETKIEEVEDEADSEEEEKEDENMKEITEIQHEWEQVNKTKPIWSMKPEDVKEEDYNAFYKTISNDWEEPLYYKHFHVEGQVEFRGILFIPKRAPFDLFNSNKKINNIKLYVRKVFINDDSKELIPEYMGFVRGVVDSEDMPLNISRETLQQNKIVKIIKKNITKKVIEMIEELKEDKEKFETFYDKFAKNLKYGVHEDSANRTKLASFLRFQTTKTDKEPKTLKDYITDMKSEQKDIYYITGESKEALRNLPFLERLIKKDLEVLYMIDPIDEYFVQQMNEYEGKKLVSVTKEGLELPETEDEKKTFEEQKKEFEPFCKRVKEILGNRVEKVELSKNMTESPCCISTSKYGWSSHMEQIMKHQALRDSTFSSHMMAKRILEVNPENSIIKEMSKRFKDDENDQVTKNLVFLIHDTAVLTSAGLTLENPNDLARRIYKMTKLGLNIIEEELGDDLPQLEERGEQKLEDETPMEEVD